MNKRRQRYTRNSYKRKAIMFGASIFTALALAATGFAAWVLSASESKEAGANVSVGAIDDQSVGLSDITFVASYQDELESTFSSIIFEPKKDDETGVIRNDGTNFEELEVTFTATVDNPSIVKNFYLESVAIPKGIKDAIDAGYITAPAWMYSEGETTTAKWAKNDDGTYTPDGKAYVIETEGETTTVVDTKKNNIDYITYEVGQDGVATLTFSIKFGWGEKFGGVNPGEYYDGLETVDVEAVKTDLHTFKAMLHEIDVETYKTNYYEAGKVESDLNEDHPIGELKFMLHAET